MRGRFAARGDQVGFEADREECLEWHSERRRAAKEAAQMDSSSAAG
jgi:hypothetical protein